MNITIHRGSNEIGGTCIEIEQDGCRIILDLGIPLTKTGGMKFSDNELQSPTFKEDQLPNIKGLYVNDTPTVDAVLLSHAHMDHYGLMDFIHPDIPIYLSKDAEAILEVGNIFWSKKMQQKDVLKHCRTFNYWKKFNVRQFSITPYLVDHSAYGACAYLIESAGKKVFYTGDFRAHGNKKVTFDNMLKDNALKGVDALIIEGTTLGDGHKSSLPSEEDVRIKMTEAFSKQQDVSFVMCAGSNIDRLISLFKATKETGKELVLDLYQYYLLSKLKAVYGKSKLPPLKDDHIRIRYIKGHADKIAAAFGPELLYKYNHKKITLDEIINNREKLVLRFSMKDMALLAKKMNEIKDLKQALFIYSMWSGYLKEQPSLHELHSKFNIPMMEIHTSGHAYKNDLLRFIDALQPKVLIPVHTLNANEYKKEVKTINVTTNKQISL